MAHAVRAVWELLGPVLDHDLPRVERAALTLDTWRTTETVVFVLFARALADGHLVSVLTSTAHCIAEQLDAFHAHYLFHAQGIAADTAAVCPAVSLPTLISLVAVCRAPCRAQKAPHDLAALAGQDAPAL